MKASASPATAPQPQSRPGQALRFIAVLVFVALAFPLLVLAGLLAWRQYRVLTSWPEVDAVVTRIDSITRTNHNSHPPLTYYGARFTFRYTANGRAYDSSADLGYTSAVRSDIEHSMAEMPVGSHRQLRYDPAHPSNINLASGFTSVSFSAPFALARWAGLITLVCAALFLFGWRAARRHRHDPAASGSGAKPRL